MHLMMRALTCVLALAPVLASAFVVPGVSRMILHVGAHAERRDASLSLQRRDAIAAVPLGIAGTMLPPLGADLAAAEAWFTEDFSSMDKGDMQWPPALDGDAVVEAGAAKLPAVGFGMYNTKAEMSVEAVTLALAAGVRHIDTAAEYANEKEIGIAWRGSGLARNEIYLSSKLSNVAMRSGKIRQAVKESLAKLQTDYLDAYYLHSPLASSEQRNKAWKELHTLQKEGLIREVGVANFGVEKIKLLQAANPKLPPPALIQAEISPFNQRRDLVRYASEVNARVVCSAWSKLSNKETGAKGWGQFAEICGKRGLTKAQGLILWSLSRGAIFV